MGKTKVKKYNTIVLLANQKYFSLGKLFLS